MDITIRPSVTAPISYKGETTHRIGERVRDNSTEITAGGGAGLATFATLNQSSKIGNGLVKAVKTSKSIKDVKQAQILELLGKCKPLAKYVNNPIVRKITGGLAGLSAATTLVGSTAKIADTYGFLTAQNPAA